MPGALAGLMNRRRADEAYNLPADIPEKLFFSMLFHHLTRLMLCSSLLLIVFQLPHGDSARPRRRIRLYP